MDWFLSLLTNTSGVGHIVMLYAFVIAAGIALGRVKIGGKKNGIALGVTFVLFVGILMGHLYKSAGVVSLEGFAAPGNVLTFIQDFGLILFVYCIGLQVGPGFLESFKTGGLKMNLIAVGIVLLNVICCIGLFFMIFYKGGSMAGENSRSLAMMVGVLCGAITNTPGLGAATEACGSIFGSSAPSIANGYACAYPLGVVGIILAIERAVFHKHIPGRLYVDAVGTAMPERAYRHTTYDHVFAILRHHVPVESLVEGDALNQDILAIDRSDGLWQEHLAAVSDSVEDAILKRHLTVLADYLDVECLLPIILINLAVGRRADDTPSSRNGNVFSVMGIDKSSEGIDLNTLVAGKNHGQVVLNLTAEMQGGLFAEMQIDSRLQFYTPGLPVAGRNDNGSSALLRHLVDGLLDGLRIHL